MVYMSYLKNCHLSENEQLKNYNLSKLEKFEKISKKHTSFKNGNFVNASKKLLKTRT